MSTGSRDPGVAIAVLGTPKNVDNVKGCELGSS